MNGLYHFGPFQFDVAEHRLLRDGSEVPLQLKTFEILCLLVQNAGRLMTKEELLARIWPDAIVEENNLSKNVSLLRKALGEHATGQAYIETVTRIGYRFVAEVRRTDSEPGVQSGDRSSAASPVPSVLRQQIQFCTAADGVRLAYSSAGCGYPLVKAANWLNHLDYEWNSPLWKHWIGALTKHHRLIRYDERGNGLSQWDVRDMSLEHWVQDLETTVEAAGVARFALLGISQGGAVAVTYAVRHPERVSHLVLLGAYSRGWSIRGTQEQREARTALETLVRLDWGKNNPDFKSMFTNLYIPFEATSDQQRWFNELQQISTTAENACRIMMASDAIDVRPFLSQVSVPTIVFHGDRDRVVPLEEGKILASEIPGARFVPLNTGNHILLAGEPAWQFFLQELGAFLGWENDRAVQAV